MVLISAADRVFEASEEVVICVWVSLNGFPKLGVVVKPTPVWKALKGVESSVWPRNPPGSVVFPSEVHKVCCYC